jgi:MFS family permease
MAESLGAGAEGVFRAQMVMTMPSLAMMITAPLSGWIAERTSYRRVLQAALVLFPAAGLMALIFNSFHGLLICRFVIGIAAGAMATSSFGVINQLFTGTDRDKMFGYTSAATAAVAISGAVISGLLVATFGWQSIFWLYGSAIPILLLSLVCIDKELPRRSEARQGAAAEVPTEVHQKHLRTLFGILLLMTLIAIVNLNTGVQFPFLLKDRGLGDARLVSAVVTTSCLAMFIGGSIFQRANAKFGTYNILVVMILLEGLGHLTAGLLQPFAAMLVAVVFMGVATAFMKPLTAHYIFTHLPPSLHGRATGALISFIFMGAFLNPILLKPVVGAMGREACIVLLGVLACTFAVALFALPLLMRKPAPAQN